MTKLEIYKLLEGFSAKDDILINGEKIARNEDLTDDFFNLTDYADNEETFERYTFEKVTYLTIRDGFFFENENSIFETEFISKNYYKVINTFDKD